MVEWILAIVAFLSGGYSLYGWKKKLDTILACRMEEDIVKDEIPFSVLLCVKGDAPKLSKYVDKIINQHYHSFELIIVYKDVQEDFFVFMNAMKHRSNVRWIELKSDDIYLEKKQALHRGIQEATYEWIVTIDDDCYPENEYWLSEINKKIASKDSDIILGLSPYISQKGLLNQWIRYDAFLVAVNYTYRTCIGKPYMGVGRNMAFKKELWNEAYLTQFSQKGSGDDTTLVQYYRDTKKLEMLVYPLVYSFPKLKFNEWLVQKMRHIESGKEIDRASIKFLMGDLFTPLFFWISVWLWLSYFSFSFLIPTFAIVYLTFRISMQLWISDKLGFKRKPIFYSIVLEVPQILLMCILPILSPIIKRRWK